MENKSLENKSLENKSLENKSLENKSLENKSLSFDSYGQLPYSWNRFGFRLLSQLNFLPRIWVPAILAEVCQSYPAAGLLYQLMWFEARKSQPSIVSSKGWLRYTDEIQADVQREMVLGLRKQQKLLHKLISLGFVECPYGTDIKKRCLFRIRYDHLTKRLVDWFLVHYDDEYEKDLDLEDETAWKTRVEWIFPSKKPVLDEWEHLHHFVYRQYRGLLKLAMEARSIQEREQEKALEEEKYKQEREGREGREGGAIKINEGNV